MTEPLVVPAPRFPLKGVYRRAARLYAEARGLVHRTGIEHVRGVPLVVLPDVFNPNLFRSGALLAEAVAADLGTNGDRRVLDLGTGSGVGAVTAALAGARVVAVDINPEAARCARLNVALHRLEGRVDVREGDLFAPVAGEAFDRVVFNPPFFRGRPSTRWDAAWRGEDVLERFAAGLGSALAPGGHALVLLSTDGGQELLPMLEEAGFGIAVARRRRFVDEIETVYRVGRSP